MIKNGYYFPYESWNKLTHINYETGEIVGSASISIDLGSRSSGKTVGWIFTLLKNFRETGERFCLMSRTQKQIEKGYLKNWICKFLNIIKSNDKDTEELLEWAKNQNIEFNKNNIKINNNILCYCVPISMSEQVKEDIDFNNCKNLVMDEAIRPGERTSYIQGRPTMERIWEIFITMARGSENSLNTSNIIFISNVSEYNNWIFNDLNIQKFFKEESKFTCQNGIVINRVINKIKNEELKQSIVGNVMNMSKTGTKYLNSSFLNEYTDNSDFIKKIGLNFNDLEIQLYIKNRFLGVFKNEYFYHIGEIEKDSRSEIITNEPNSHSEQIKYDPNNQIIILLKNKYIRRKITFQDQVSKDLFLQFIGFL